MYSVGRRTRKDGTKVNRYRRVLPDRELAVTPPPLADEPDETDTDPSDVERPDPVPTTVVVPLSGRRGNETTRRLLPASPS